MKKLLLALAFIGLAACSYETSAPITPAYDVYTSYSDKLPGRYALFINADRLDGEAKVTGQVCSAHNYPLLMADAFTRSLVLTMEQLVEEVQIVPHPLRAQDIRAQGFVALVRIDATDLDARLYFEANQFSSQAKAQIAFAFGVTAEGHEGRVFGTKTGADANFDGDRGAACNHGNSAVSNAASKAMKDAMERFGERFSNDQRLRQYAHFVTGRPMQNPYAYPQQGYPQQGYPQQGYPQPYQQQPYQQPYPQQQGQQQQAPQQVAPAPVPGWTSTGQ